MRPRTSFDGVYYNRKIYFIFGRQSYFGPKKEKKSCLDDVVIYNTLNDEITVQVPEHEPYKFFPGRHNYAGFLIENMYYFHGG